MSLGTRPKNVMEPTQKGEMVKKVQYSIRKKKMLVRSFLKMPRLEKFKLTSLKFEIVHPLWNFTLFLLTTHKDF
jgi:hypothetical protein